MKVKELIEKLKEYPDNFDVDFSVVHYNEKVELGHITYCAEVNKIIIVLANDD